MLVCGLYIATLFNNKMDPALELVDLVRIGYQKAALPYSQQKDDSLLQLAIFQMFLDSVPKKGLLLGKISISQSESSINAIYLFF